jgi:hypothetical protein
MIRSLQHIAQGVDQLEAFKNDIQTCSFLVRAGADDAFRFAHKSFIEYFVARKLVADLAGGHANIEKPSMMKDTRYHTEWRESSLEKYTSSRFLRTYERMSSSATLFVSIDMKQATPNVSFRTLLEREIRAIFERQTGLRDVSEFSLSEEIATFAVECLENMEISLSDLVSRATTKVSVGLVGEILRLGKGSEFVRRHVAYMRDYVRTGDQELLKVSFCAALSKLAGAVDATFLGEARAILPPQGWSYFLVELAARAECEIELFNECLKWSDLRKVDRIICAHAIRERIPSRAHDALAESLILDLFDSGEPDDLRLGVALCASLRVSSNKIASVAMRAYTRSDDRENKEEILTLLGTLRGRGAWQTVRALGYQEQEPRLKRKLKAVESEMREADSLPRTRESWERAKSHREVKEQMWKSLRR